MADNPQLRGEIGEFLVSRRMRITPVQAGLRVFGNGRRVAGLRREEVATLAGVSAEYYTRVERGNVTGVSESVLDGIAHALQLDEAERGPSHQPGPGRRQHPTRSAAPLDPPDGRAQRAPDPRLNAPDPGVRRRQPARPAGGEQARGGSLRPDLRRPG